jgi:hypothetical protein
MNWPKTYIDFDITKPEKKLGGIEVSSEPFFLIGAQRSGTTLVRLILNAHSQVAIPEEGTFFMPLLKKKYLGREFSGPSLKSLTGYLEHNPQFKLWGGRYDDYFQELSERKKITLGQLISDIYTVYSHGEGKQLWGDKTPSFFRKIDILAALFPEGKFVHIVRDGRDVFNSWRKMDPSKDNAPLVALDWSYKLRTIERSLEKMSPENHTTIRYEDLLENPENQVKSLCSFLAIEYQESMLDFYQTSSRYIGQHHSALIFQPLNKENRYKWKQKLTRREIDAFTRVAHRCLRKYGYEIPQRTMSILDGIHLMGQILVGVPQRLWNVFRVKRSYEQALKKGRSATDIAVGQTPTAKEGQ